MESTKQCSRCHKVLDLSSFQKGYRFCRACYRQGQNTKNLIQSLLLDDYYIKNPCAVCGESDPNKLQVDHINPDLKPRNKHGRKYGQMSHMPLSVMLKDLACDNTQTLCASCHQLKTRTEQDTVIKPDMHIAACLVHGIYHYTDGGQLRKRRKYTHDPCVASIPNKH
jgi:hypothetical protein